MNPFKRFLAWLKPLKIERGNVEPDSVYKPKEESARMKHRRDRYDMKKRRVNLYRPGPFFPKVSRLPFMVRTKASRLQTLGQANSRGNYIIETDPPDRKTVIRHMHSHAKWMARAQTEGAV